MVSDGVYLAVVDCVKGGQSCLTVEEGASTASTLEVSHGALPPEAGKNAVVHIRVEGGRVVEAVDDKTVGCDSTERNR